MLKPIIALTLFVAVVNARVNDWENCGSPSAEIREVYVTGCTQTPCTIVRGQRTEIVVAAVSLRPVFCLPFNLTAQLDPVRSHLIHGDGCESLLYGECPSEAGSAFRFVIYVDVPAAFPAVNTSFNVDVTNGFGQRQICFNVAVRII